MTGTTAGPDVGRPHGAPGSVRRPVLVIGAGAVGSFLAGVLAAGEHPVTLVDRRNPPGPDTLVIVDAEGVRTETRLERIGATTDAAIVPGLIVLAVKVFDLEAALAACRVWPDAPSLTIQNGVGAEDLVVERRPGAALIAGSVTTPLEATPDGIAWRRRGGLALAPVAGPVEPLIDELLAAAAAVGLPARRMDDARAMKWSKLVANLVGNATSALLDREPGAIYREPRLFAIERAQLVEALAVMDALGIRPVALPGGNVPLLARALGLPALISRPALARVVGGARGGKMPSLRQHLRSGRPGPTEVGWLNGSVARWGRRLGVPTPVNERLATLVDAAADDPQLRVELAGHPERLVAAMEASSLAGADRPAGPGDDERRHPHG